MWMISLREFASCLWREKVQPFNPGKRTEMSSGPLLGISHLVLWTQCTLQTLGPLCPRKPPTSQLPLCLSHNGFQSNAGLTHIHVDFRPAEIATADGGNSFMGGVRAARRTSHAPFWCCRVERQDGWSLLWLVQLAPLLLLQHQTNPNTHLLLTEILFKIPE